MTATEAEQILDRFEIENTDWHPMVAAEGVSTKILWRTCRHLLRRHDASRTRSIPGASHASFANHKRSHCPAPLSACLLISAQRDIASTRAGWPTE
jgi:hypothetical protein